MGRPKKTEMVKMVPDFNINMCTKIHDLYQKEMFCDTQILTTSSNLYAHSVVLAACSSTIGQLLRESEQTNTMRVSDGCSRFVLNLKSHKCTRAIAKSLLQYCYTGVFDQHKHKSLPRLRSIIEYLGFDTLIELCDGVSEVKTKKELGTVKAVKATKRTQKKQSGEANIKLEPESSTKFTEDEVEDEPQFAALQISQPEDNTDINTIANPKLEKVLLGSLYSGDEQTLLNENSVAMGIDTMATEHDAFTHLTDDLRLKSLENEENDSVGNEPLNAGLKDAQEKVKKSKGRLKGNRVKTTATTTKRRASKPDLKRKRKKSNVEEEEEAVVVKKGRKKIRCRECNKSFRTHEEKNEHKKTSRAVECPEEGCDFAACSQRKVFKHRHFTHQLSLDFLEHDPKCKIYKCKKCDYRGLDEKHLRQHQITHKEIQHICPHCGKGFKHKYTFQAHVNGFHKKEEQRPYVCEVCSKGFLSKSNLTTHMNRVHLGKLLNDVYCEHCGYHGAAKRNLYEHLWNVHDIPPPAKSPRYKCDVCGYKTVQKHNFNIHQKRHTGERPHVCDVCGRGYVTIHELRAHMEFHKKPDERRFKCEHCAYGAISKWKLKRHVETVHSKPDYKPFQCDICDYKTNVRSNLVMHLRNTHKMNVETKKPIQNLLLKTARGMVNPSPNPDPKRAKSKSTIEEALNNIKVRKNDNIFSSVNPEDHYFLNTAHEEVMSHKSTHEMTSLRTLPPDSVTSSDPISQEWQVFGHDFTQQTLTSSNKSTQQIATSLKTDSFVSDFTENGE